jgi:hypothetical protein
MWEAQLETIKGWKKNTQKAALFGDLPQEA